MAELKTRPNDENVEAFLASVENEQRREDCRTVMKILARITDETPKMWGGSIIGFGSYDYRYDSGRTGTWFRTGVSPRKQALTVYVMAGFDRYDEIMSRLGTYRTGTSCLYVKRLEDIDLDVLEELARASLDHMERQYPRGES